jgi:hypothetical protein
LGLYRVLTKITGADIRDYFATQDQSIAVVFESWFYQVFTLMDKRIIDNLQNSLVFHFIHLELELEPLFAHEKY